MRFYFHLLGIILTSLFFTNCGETNADTPLVPTDTIPRLKTNFTNAFTIGAALNEAQILETDQVGASLIKKEFNTITPENNMKWMYIHPTLDSFNFSICDQYVEFGRKNNMHIVGHALLWHSQIAEYMNEVKDSALMASYIDQHIRKVAGHYKGKIDTWDVVNEALNEDGTFRESNFFKVMGPSYLEQAFRTAAEVDPTATLIYNDYNMWKPEKRAGAVKLVKNLQEKGIKIDGVGMQAHWSLIGPDLKDVENSILAYAELGVKVMFTELDVTALPNPWELEGAEVSQNFEGSPFMDPYPDGLPDSMQVKLAERYSDIFNLFLKHQDKISRVTFWGVNDGGSWLNNWPIENRTNHPLFFDRNYLPKPAYHKVMNLNQPKN